MLHAYALLFSFLAFVGASVASAWSFVVAPFRAARTRALAVDEGGVRCRIGGTFVYWPFALLGRATFDGPGIFLPPHGLITLRSPTDGIIFQMPFLREREDSVFESMCAEGAVRAIEERRSTVVPSAPAAAAAIARLGRPLRAWCCALDALVSGDDGGYRRSAVDFEALLEVAADPRHDAELRAGSVYTLLAGAPEDARAAARATLQEGSPPIVLLMARLSPGGAGLGIEEDLAVAVRYLDDDQAAALVAAPRV
jgi:hypothetical protein